MPADAGLHALLCRGNEWHSVTGSDDGLSITRPDLNLWLLPFPGQPDAFLLLNPDCCRRSITFVGIYTYGYGQDCSPCARKRGDEIPRLQHEHQPPYSFTYRHWLDLRAATFIFSLFHFSISIDMTTTVLLRPLSENETFEGILGAFVYILLQNYLSDITIAGRSSWDHVFGAVIPAVVRSLRIRGSVFVGNNGSKVAGAEITS
jgi:hypothetical protein